MGDTRDHVALNRARWDAWAADYAEAGEQGWAEEPAWGIWGVPEATLHLLPDDLAGRHAVELGCGTAYASAWLARRGARVVGVDLSPRQLATARRLQRHHRMDFPLLHADAERLPLADQSFDFAISEYGASLWADPQRWLPEAARVLRPGARLVFLVGSHLTRLCFPDDENLPAGETLLRPAFAPARIQWPGADSVEFMPSHGQWIRLLRAAGFEIEELLEVRPPQGATTRHPLTTLEWARKWPCEEVWKVRRQGWGHRDGV